MGGRTAKETEERSARRGRCQSWKESQSPAMGLQRHSLALWRHLHGLPPSCPDFQVRWRKSGRGWSLTHLGSTPSSSHHDLPTGPSRFRSPSQPSVCLAENKTHLLLAWLPGSSFYLQKQAGAGGDQVNSVSGSPQGGMEDAGKQLCACPLPTLFRGRSLP